MKHIDGSLGEGGGQVLRSAIGLACVTGEPVCIDNIRAKRDKPGLRPQHVKCVEAAAIICGGTYQGVTVQSSRVTFHPGKVQPGDYHFDIGTAGSTALVLQTLLPPLLMAGDHSSVTVTGGTHNPMAPTAHFLHHCFAQALRRLGASVGFQLLRPGFYPRGGGKLVMHLSPRPLGRIDWTQRGALVSVRADILIVDLPFHVAQREMQAVREHLRASGWPLPAGTVREPENATGPGNVVSIRAIYEQADEVFSSFGRKGVPAETVAKEAAQSALHWLLSGVPVGPHLADQLLIPMALAGGGSFVTTALDQHTPTNAAVVEQMVGVKTTFETIEQDRVLVRVGDRAD